jgi:flagellar biosynthesis/type III secretory pathway chaperone
LNVNTIREEVKESTVFKKEKANHLNSLGQNHHFYKEFCRLYYAKVILSNRLQQLLNEKQELNYQLSNLENNKLEHEKVLGMAFEIDNEKKKRHRRVATDIARHYKCPCHECPKSYGSEGSLN